MFDKLSNPDIKETTVPQSDGEKFMKSLDAESTEGKDFIDTFKDNEHYGELEVKLGDDFLDSIRSDFRADRKGSQWENQNGDLKPNIEYKTGEYDYKYKTDEQGRIISVETNDLKRTEREERLPHNSDSPDKKAGDDAGHLIGDRFGGSPDIDNIVSQLSEVNHGEYKKMEDEWAERLLTGVRK
jgi:hypothetical protein